MKIIDNSSQVQHILFTPKFSAICSIGDRPFYGNVQIDYEPTEVILELVSVERFIGNFAMKRVTIEDVARLVFDELCRVLGDIPIRVIVSAWTTVHAPTKASIKQGEFRYD